MRYKIIQGRESWHDVLVVDTSKPTMIGDKQYKDHFEAVCVCVDLSDAETICAALNKQ